MDHLFLEFHSARFGFYAHVLYRFASDGGANTCPLKVFYYASSVIYTYIYTHVYVCMHYIYTYVYICDMHVCIYIQKRHTYTTQLKCEVRGNTQR